MFFGGPVCPRRRRTQEVLPPSLGKADSIREPPPPENLAKRPFPIGEARSLRRRRAALLLRERLHVVLPDEVQPHALDRGTQELREADRLALVVRAPVADLKVMEIDGEQRVPRSALGPRADRELRNVQSATPNRPRISLILVGREVHDLRVLEDDLEQRGDVLLARLGVGLAERPLEERP